eukprot:10952852-Heterocapsa_arctica.AAC.1
MDGDLVSFGFAASTLRPVPSPLFDFLPSLDGLTTVKRSGLPEVATSGLAGGPGPFFPLERLGGMAGAVDEADP